MEDYEAAWLRLQCLELAERLSIAYRSSTYTLVTDAEKYWTFVKGEPKTVPAPKSDAGADDIPF